MGLWNLIVKVKGDNSELKNTLNDSERKVNSFGNSIKRIGGWIAAAFSVKAIIEFGKAIIGSSDRLSDKFTVAMTGAKEATDSFLRTIANGDFKNLINSLIEGYKRGSDLAKKLDELADKKAYDDYIISVKKRTSVELAETVKNKTLEKNIRASAAAERMKTEEDIQKRTEAIAKKTFDLEKATWEKRNGMASDYAVKLVEKIQSLPESMQDVLQGIFEKSTSFKDINARNTFLRQQAIPHGYSDQLMKDYGEFFNLLQVGEEDVIPKLFATHKTYQDIVADAQERFNSILKETSALLRDEKNTIDNPTNPISTITREEGPSPVPIPSLVSTTTLAPINTQLNSDLDEMKRILISGKEMAVDLGAQLVEGLGEALASGNIQDVGKQLLSSFAGFLSQFGKLLFAYGVAHTAFYESLTAGPMGGPIALAAGAALMAAAGAIKGLMSRTSSGGVGGSNYSSQANGSMQTIKVNVTGKIKGKDIGIALNRNGY